jgi:hypothetical protein
MIENPLSYLRRHLLCLNVQRMITDHLRPITLRVTVLITRQRHSGVRRGIFRLSATSGASMYVHDEGLRSK